MKTKTDYVRLFLFFLEEKQSMRKVPGERRKMFGARLRLYGSGILNRASFKGIAAMRRTEKKPLLQLDPWNSSIYAPGGNNAPKLELNIAVRLTA